MYEYLLYSIMVEPIGRPPLGGPKWLNMGKTDSLLLSFYHIFSIDLWQRMTVQQSNNLEFGSDRFV